MSTLKDRMRDLEGARGETFARGRAAAIPSVEVARAGGDASVLKSARYREYDPGRVRPWRYHNRAKAWLDRPEQRALEASIRSQGQQALGLVRAVEGVESIDGEVVYGFRRAHACAAIGVAFKARVLPADTPDAFCMEVMHSENHESEDVSDLENARVYKRLLDDGVYGTQQALGEGLGVSQVYVSRLIAAADIYRYEWLLPVLEPILPDVSVRAAATLVKAMADGNIRRRVRERARRLATGARELEAKELVAALLGDERRAESGGRRRLVEKRGRANVAVVESDAEGNVKVALREHAQTEDERRALVDRVVDAMETQYAGRNDEMHRERKMARALAEIAARGAAGRERREALLWLAGAAAGCAQSAGLAARAVDGDRLAAMVVALAGTAEKQEIAAAIMRALGEGSAAD